METVTGTRKSMCRPMAYSAAVLARGRVHLAVSRNTKLRFTNKRTGNEALGRWD